MRSRRASKSGNALAHDFANMQVPSVAMLAGGQQRVRHPNIPWHDPDTIAALERSVALHTAAAPQQNSHRSAAAPGRVTPTGSRDGGLAQQPGNWMSDASYQLVPTDAVEEEIPDWKKELQQKRSSIGKGSEPVERSEWSQCGVNFLTGACFQTLMACLIIGNSAVIGMETDIRDYPYWNQIENAFLVAFLCELLLKLTFYGPREMYKKIPENIDFNWNCFDTFIVTLGVLDVVASFIIGHSSGPAATMFRMIRLLRILRIIRIVKFLKQLYLLAFGLVEAAQAVFWVTILMAFILYVCGIIMVKTVGRPDEDDPHYQFMNYHYGHVIPAMLTLFVLMSSPNLPVYQDEAGLLEAHPFFAIFLVIFIIFGSFGMIALLTGVISQSMFEKNDMKKEEERAEHEILRKNMQTECSRLFNSLPLDEEEEASSEDVNTLIPEMASTFEASGVYFTEYDLVKIVKYMDVDESGSISEDEFTRGMLVLAEGVRPISIQEVHHAVGVCEVKLERILQAMESDPTKRNSTKSEAEPTTAKPHAADIEQKESGIGQQGSNSTKKELDGALSRFVSDCSSKYVKDTVMTPGGNTLEMYFEEVLSMQRKCFGELAHEVRGLATLHAEAVQRGEPLVLLKAPPPGCCYVHQDDKEVHNTNVGSTMMRQISASLPLPPMPARSQSKNISGGTAAWPGAWAHATPTLGPHPSRPEELSSEFSLNLNGSLPGNGESDRLGHIFDTFGSNGAVAASFVSTHAPPSSQSSGPLPSSGSLVPGGMVNAHPFAHHDNAPFSTLQPQQAQSPSSLSCSSPSPKHGRLLPHSGAGALPPGLGAASIIRGGALHSRAQGQVEPPPEEMPETIPNAIGAGSPPFSRQGSKQRFHHEQTHQELPSLQERAAAETERLAVAAETERLVAEVASQMKKLTGWQRDIESDGRRNREVMNSSTKMAARETNAQLTQLLAAREANSQLASLLGSLHNARGKGDVVAVPHQTSGDVLGFEDCYGREFQ